VFGEAHKVHLRFPQFLFLFKLFTN